MEEEKRIQMEKKTEPKVNPSPKTKFETLEVALEVIAALADGPLDEIRRKDKNVADQLDRASVSVALNLAEGARRSGRDRARFYAIAHGSADEGRTALRVATAKRAIDGERAAAVDVIMDRLGGMLWGLTHPRR